MSNIERIRSVMDGGGNVDHDEIHDLIAEVEALRAFKDSIGKIIRYQGGLDGTVAAVRELAIAAHAALDELARSRP